MTVAEVVFTQIFEFAGILATILGLFLLHLFWTRPKSRSFKFKFLLATFIIAGVNMASIAPLGLKVANIEYFLLAILLCTSFVYMVFD